MPRARNIAAGHVSEGMFDVPKGERKEADQVDRKTCLIAEGGASCGFVANRQSRTRYNVFVIFGCKKTQAAYHYFGEIETPSFSQEARIEAGVLLSILQRGGSLKFPSARPMPEIGSRCLELRVKDKTAEWRIFCRVDADAVLMAHVMAKKTRATPKNVMELCKKRLAKYDRDAGD